MPDTPLPHGETLGRRDEALRWFEPIVARDAAARWLEPAMPREDATDWFEPTTAAMPIEEMDDWPSGTAVTARRGDTPPRQEVSWVGFAIEADEARPSSQSAEPGRAVSTDTTEPAKEPPSAPETGNRANPAIPAAASDRRRRFPAALGLAVRLGGAIVAAAAVAVLAYALYRGAQRLGDRAAATAPQAVVPHPPPVPTEAELPPLPPDTPAARAAAYYRERAATGEAAAQYDMGVLHARGDGVVQDYGAAASWFRKAADGGSAAAAFDLGVLYERGLGVRPSTAEAVAWYRRAAANNYAAAQYNLAIAYAAGRGAPQDWNAAARLYHDAAAQGLASAMVNFAILCEHGAGIERSLAAAYAWYRAAARRGDEVAARRAGEVFDQLDVAEKGRALMLASETAVALHDGAGPAAPAAPDIIARDARPAMEAGGWLGGTGTAKRRQLPSR